MTKSKSKIQKKKLTKQEVLSKNEISNNLANNITKPNSEFLLNNLHFPLFIKDELHRWVYLNEAMCNFIGKDNKSLIGKSDFDFFPEKEAKIFWEKDDIVFRTGIDNINEENFTDIKGNTYHIQTRKSLHIDKHGNKYIFGTILDITELTKARQAEKENFHNLEFLSKSAMECNQLPFEVNIYDFICKKIYNFIDAITVVIVSHTKPNSIFKIESIKTKKENQKIIENVLGKSYSKDEYLITPFYPKLEKGVLTKVDGGLYDLVGTTINKKKCKQVEKELNIKYVYAIGLTYKNIVAGSAVLFLNKDIKPELKEVIETFIRQATIAIQKNQISKRLSESEIKYRTIFENILNVYIEIDPKGNILEMSNSVEIYSFFKREELIGKSMNYVFTCEKDYKRFIKNLKTYKTLRDYEVLLIDKKGVGHFCLINVKTETDKNGKILKYIGIINDISERKNTLEQLNISKERYKELLENANDLIFTMDLKGRLTSTNKIVEDIIGNSTSSKRDFNIKDFLLPESYKDVMEGLDRLIKKPNERALKIVDIKTLNNEIVTLEVNCFLRCKKGKPYELFGIARDITERNQIEKQIKASLKEKEVLLSEIHHRVKNNMQVIISLINMHIKKINNNILTEELQELKNRVMAMSMIHEDLYMAKNLSKIDFSRFVQKLSKSLILTYNGHGNIHQQFNISNIYIDIDKAIPFGLVVNELICNAFKYAFPEEYLKSNKLKATVNINLKMNNNNIELVISDNGIGLPDDIDINNPKTMGLSLVDILIKYQLKGKVTANKEKGTKFTISIPID